MSEPIYQTEESKGKEKHVPIIQKIPWWVKIIVGSTPHPMTTEHYIQWVEIETAKWEITREELLPTEEPEATFITDEEIIEARCSCNIHGLRKSL